MRKEQGTEKQTLVQDGRDYVYCPECGAQVIHESGCVVCPVCGAQVIHESGCVVCPVCGWSICS